MRNADLADTPLASYTPDIPGEVDSIRDILREEFAQAARGPLPATREEWVARTHQLVDRALAQINVVEFDQGAPQREAAQVVVELLQLLSRDDDRHYRMRAYCYLRLLGREGRSLEAIAAELGTTRANVDKCYRNIQDRVGLPGPADKSPEARETYRRLRTGRRRPRVPWAGAAAWARTMPSLELAEVAS